MASPAGPRPGWSRRAQYGLFFGFIALIAGTVIGLVLLAISLVAPRTFEDIRGAALDVTGPVAEALYEVKATANGLVSGAGKCVEEFEALQQVLVSDQRRGA